MLDVRRLRTELDAVKAGLARRGIDTSDLDRAADLDARQRLAMSESERLRAEVKRQSLVKETTRKSALARANAFDRSPP